MANHVLSRDVLACHTLLQSFKNFRIRERRKFIKHEDTPRSCSPGSSLTWGKNGLHNRRVPNKSHAPRPKIAGTCHAFATDEALPREMPSRFSESQSRLRTP